MRTSPQTASIFPQTRMALLGILGNTLELDRLKL